MPALRCERLQQIACNPASDPELFRARGVDDGPRENQLQRRLHADQARKPLRSAGAGKNPEFHFRQSELRVGGTHSRMTGERELEPASEAGARYRRNDALTRTVQRLDEGRQGRTPRRGGPSSPAANSSISAPAQKTFGPPQSTIASTSRSPSARWSAVSSACRVE